MTKNEILMPKLRKLLSEYDYSFSEHALESIINEWNLQKEPLRNILRKHPNWNETDDMVAFDIDLKRDIDEKATIEFMCWAMTVLGLDYQDDESSMWKVRNFPKEQFVTQEMIDIVRATYPDFKASVGQKTSRAMHKLFCELGLDKNPEYNREFAKYADALNPLKITRHTVISLNLLDFLTMSFGNSWASCHTIDKNNRRGMPNSFTGCYSSGTLSYALDSTSMVFYTVDSKYSGNEYYFEPKMNRQMFHFGEDKLVQGRLYPQSCDNGSMNEYAQFRNLMQEIIALGLGVPNLWTLKRGTDACMEAIWTHGTHYPDYRHFSNCTVSILKNSENEMRMTVGAEPICIECGCRHSEAESISCCSHGYVCEHCGCRIDDDDARWVDGEPYCCECVSWCDRCDSYHLEDDGQYVDSIGMWVCNECLDENYYYCEDCEEYYPRDRVTWIESEDRYVCDDCLDDNYYYCTNCNEYHFSARWVDSVDGYVCNECLDEDFHKCEKCGEYYRTDDMYEIEDEYYCDECHEAIMEEMEEDENEDEAV